MAKNLCELGSNDWNTPDDMFREVLKGDTLATQVLFDAMGADGILALKKLISPEQGDAGWTDDLEQREGKRIAQMILARDHKALGEYVMSQVLAYVADISGSIPREGDRGIWDSFPSMRPGAW